VRFDGAAPVAPPLLLRFLVPEVFAAYLRSTMPSAKPVGHSWSYLDCEMGHLVPVSEPYKGS
jgi:hypothetical protein